MRTPQDGTPVAREIEASDEHPAYAEAHAPVTVSVFGEWERLPKNGVSLPEGEYECRFVLTEESFHGSGGELGGFWTKALEGEIAFDIGTAPAIVQQPQSAVLESGECVVLSTAARGTAPLALQWLKDGVELEGGTDATLTLEADSEADAGQYQCRVRNRFGETKTRSAAVFVIHTTFTRNELEEAVAAAESAKDETIAAKQRNIDELHARIETLYTEEERTHAVAAATPDWDGDGFTDQQEAERETDPAVYSLHLVPGWNLISIARVPDDNSIKAVFAPVAERIQGTCWIWTPTGYRSVDTLEPQRGHWLYYAGSTPADVSVPLP